MLRFAVVFALSVVGLGAFALPVSAPVGEDTAVVTVQENAPRTWDSPSRVNPDFPHLSAEDCRRYGARYDYPECRFALRAPDRTRERQPATASKVRADRGAAVDAGKPERKRIKPALEDKKEDKKLASRAAPKVEHDGSKPSPAATQELSSLSPKADHDSEKLNHRLEVIAGQLLLLPFDGKQPGDADVERLQAVLRDGKAAGFIINADNISNALQLRTLLAALATESKKGAPLIAIDQPGGSDSILSEDKGFAFYTSANLISSEQNPYGAQLVYRDMAAELASLGVNINIGPSADVCRDEGVDLSASCFGTVPSHVAAFATAFNFAHHDKGVLTALRHVPFRRGIQTTWITERANTAILREVTKREPSDALVVRVKAIEPASLSRAAFGLPSVQTPGDIYRGFGFHGALIFDLDMGTSGAPIRYDEAIIRAVASGADMILLRNSTVTPAEMFTICHGALMEGVKSGRLQMTRLEDAYRHGEALKERLRGLQPKQKVARAAQ